MVASSETELDAAYDVLTAALASDVATGWQLAVSVNGEVSLSSDGVDALGRSVQPDSLFAVYCCIKPVVALCVAVAVQVGELSWEDEVGHLLPDVDPSLSRVTVRSLLDHSSGVVHPRAIEATTVALAARRAMAIRSAPRPLAASQTAYSEAASWMLLGAMLEAATSSDLRSFAECEVLGPLDVGRFFDLSAAPSGANLDNLRLNVAWSDGRRWPVLLERTDRLDWSTNPGYGGRASCVGLMVLAREVLDALGGNGRVLLRSTATEMLRSHGPRDDVVLNRHCSFAAGWMTDLAQHRFGRTVSAGAFGQVGFVGMTGVWADPPRGLAAAYHLNGVTDGATAIDWVRSALVDAVTSACGRRGPWATSKSDAGPS